MALVKIGYFCSAGETELGATWSETDPRQLAAIDAFLRRIDDARIEWSRQFPARRKPGPKLGRVSLRDAEHTGFTGLRLTKMMLERLRKHPESARELHAVVLIDDADCRFCEDGALLAWELQLERDVQEATSRPDIPFIALLASPEVEVWLLADWERGFGGHYPTLQHALGVHLAQSDILGRRPWTQVETYGCPYDHARGSCTNKLSEVIDRLLCAIKSPPPAPPEARVYSKRTDGPDMLRQVRPDVVAQTCRIVFAPALRRIHALVDAVELAARTTVDGRQRSP